MLPDLPADVGTATFSDPVIEWSGDLLVDEVATITYSVTVDQPIGGDTEPSEFGTRLAEAICR
jgi:hypothetical protein